MRMICHTSGASGGRNPTVTGFCGGATGYLRRQATCAGSTSLQRTSRGRCGLCWRWRGCRAVPGHAGLRRVSVPFMRRRKESRPARYAGGDVERESRETEVYGAFPNCLTSKPSQAIGSGENSAAIPCLYLVAVGPRRPVCHFPPAGDDISSSSKTATQSPPG